MPGTRLFDVRAALAALAALALAGMAALAMAIVTHLPAPTASGPVATHASSTGLSRLQSLPLQAQSVISSTLGTGSRSFAARRMASGWGLSGGGVRAYVRGGEPTLSLATGNTLSLSLAGAALPTSVTAHANRVTLTRPSIREWYAAGPLGIEQGFTLAHRPAAATAHGVTLSLVVGGSLRAQAAGSNVNLLNAHGGVAVHYGGLTAVDATGRHLAGALSVVHGRVLISVNDRGARYPITIDPLVQQGGKLTPNDEAQTGFGSGFGGAVALSADGNTALIGGFMDNNDFGAAWVFTRSNGVWSQQGSKLLPNDKGTAASDFGISVALSADGNTALIGGDFDSSSVGAAWVFTRSGARWAQQGAKLIVNCTFPCGGPKGTGEVGSGGFGRSVALSSDGNTALIGAPDDSSSLGAAWVFTRSNSNWSEQTEINPTDRTQVGGNQDAAHFGASVALSTDGNTALIGGPNDNTNVGSVWVFTRSGTNWPELQMFGPATFTFPGPNNFGSAVDLSADGTTALIGGPENGNPATGSAWVFVKTGPVSSPYQQQAELDGTGITGNDPRFGGSVSLSSDGSTALVGSPGDGSSLGSAWLFTRSGSSWNPQGTKLSGQGQSQMAEFGSGVALAADGQTAMIGGSNDTGQEGAAWAFAPPNPVCSSVSATTAIGGGSVAFRLSCSFPTGARPAFSVVGGPSHGTLSGLNAATGQLTYTSSAQFAGQDSFVYSVGDQWGLSNTATATLNVPPLPVPTCSNVMTKGKAGATRLTVTLKCKGPAGHAFTYGIVSKPGNGKLGKINQSNGKVTYTTHIGAQGTDRFVYHATDAGGASKPSTATIKLPQLKRINATMQWNFSTTTATFTRITGQFIVNGVPGGAKVFLSCTGKGCPIAKHTLTVPKQRVCKGKGKKRKCRRAEPAKGNVDLLKFVANRHLPVGDHLIVSMVESGWIGKQYNFKTLKNGQPSKAINFLAPGSATRLCPLC